ncbi:MAG TPA: hypothetical protein VF756_08105 [Thermoanaerobaculia bacterium]
MNQQKLSQRIAAGILAALLVLPGAAWAHPTDTRSPASLLEWLARLWQSGVSVLWSADEAPPTEDQGGNPGGETQATPAGEEDQGHGWEPNG